MGRVKELAFKQLDVYISEIQISEQGNFKEDPTMEELNGLMTVLGDFYRKYGDISLKCSLMSEKQDYWRELNLEIIELEEREE